MKNILFDFDSMSIKDKAAKLVSRTFARAGANVVQQDVSASIKRTAGVSFRELTMTFADSQSIVLRIKQSGDIYQALLNGRVVPIKNQDDHAAAISELVKAMDAGRTKFQKKLAAIAVKPPPGIRTAAPKMEQALTQKRDGLKELIASVRDEISKVAGTPTASKTNSEA